MITTTPPRNGMPTATAPIPEPSIADSAPPAPPKTDGNTKDAIKRLLDIAAQFHLRGLPRVGKSSLAVALANVVNDRESVQGTTERSDALRDQSIEIVTGNGTQPTKIDNLEVYRFTLGCWPAGVVSCPHEPANLKSAEVVDFYASNPGFVFVPVIWGPRAHPLAMRNVFFGQAGALQRKSAGADPRAVLRAAFRLATNDERPDQMEAYGVDGLDELFADPKMAKSRLIVSPRRGPVAQLRFDGLGRKGVRYEEMLVELTEKVVRQDRLDGLDAIREIQHGLPQPVLCIAGWDLVCDYDALYRQPDLPDQLFRWFFGAHRTRTDKNFIPVCNIRGRVKTDARRLGQKYVQDTSPEGAERLLSVFEEKLRSIGPPPASARVSPKPPQAAAPTTRSPVAAPAEEVSAAAPVERRESEESLCCRKDTLRESVFRTSRAIPALFVTMLLAALTPVSAAAWWVTLILLGSLAIAGGLVWTRLRTQLFHGTWSVFRDGQVELRRGSQQTIQPTKNMRLAASLWERWLDTGRCYVGDDVRPWRVYRLGRFERASLGLTARAGHWGTWTLLGLAGLTVLALWITLHRSV